MVFVCWSDSPTAFTCSDGRHWTVRAWQATLSRRPLMLACTCTAPKRPASNCSTASKRLLTLLTASGTLQAKNILLAASLARSRGGVYFSSDV